MKLGSLLALMTLAVAAHAQDGAAPPGYADYRTFDFNTAPSSRVNVPWEFYWHSLLTPNTIRQAGAPAYTQGGDGWNQHGDSDPLGYGTYHLRLLLPPTYQGMSLFFPAINSASIIWIDGTQVASSGIVGTDAESTRAELTSFMLSLPGRDTVDIVIQVSNYVHPTGGLWNYPRIGRTTALMEQVTRSNGIENFFAGSLLAMACYQLILYFLYRRGRPFLWLALVCLAVALRSMVIHGGSLLLPNLFPSVSFLFWKKLEFGSVYAVVAFFPLYIYDLFPDHAPVRPLRFFVVIGILCTLTVVFFSQLTFALVLEVVHLCYLLNFAYAVYSITKAWRSGNTDARIILYGILSCFPFILLEIMKNSAFIGLNIPSMYYVEIGVLVFLLFQVYLLANHQAKSHKALEAMNISLEGMVNERTRELVAATDVRDKLLSVISHDVRSPLNSLHGMLDLYNRGKVTHEEFLKFSKEIQVQLGSTGLLLENILLWTTSQLRGAKPKNETIALKDLVKRNVELFQSNAAAKQVTLSYQLDDSLSVRWDRNILHLALRNLLANAIKFSHEGGMVEILTTAEGKDVHLTVKDHGVGMDPSTIEALLSSKPMASREGTGRETGAGVGLSLVREYLLHAGGGLIAESVEGKGSRFTIVIPGNGAVGR